MAQLEDPLGVAVLGQPALPLRDSSFGLFGVEGAVARLGADRAGGGGLRA